MKLTYVISVAYASLFVLPWLSIETLAGLFDDENKCVGCLMCAGFCPAESMFIADQKTSRSSA